ncbi:hypothetical protein D3C79_960460 [compost metagenome]
MNASVIAPTNAFAAASVIGGTLEIIIKSLLFSYERLLDYLHSARFRMHLFFIRTQHSCNDHHGTDQMVNRNMLL